VFDGARPNQTYTAIILDLPITIVPTEPPKFVINSESAYLCLAQTSLRATCNDSKTLTSQREALVPFATSEIASTGPHLIVALLFSEPSNYTLPIDLQRELSELDECSREEFDLNAFQTAARLGNPVAATWFTINNQEDRSDDGTAINPTVTQTVAASGSVHTSVGSEKGESGYRTTITPTITHTVTASGTSSISSITSSAYTLSADVSSTVSGGPITLGQPVTGSQVFSNSTTSSTYSSATGITNVSVNIISSVTDTKSSLTTLTLNPTAALPVTSGVISSIASFLPSVTASAGLTVTAGGVREEPAFIAAVGALAAIVGVYWVFL
jgi:hypothetical protein